MSGLSSRESLIAILQLAYSGERAAGYAYRGHWHSVRNADERREIEKIENEEWQHRELVGQMLQSLDSRPSPYREVRAIVIGKSLAALCHVGGWLAPMFGAGRLESGNIREYESAARYARDCGRGEFVDCLLTMAEVEWDHERYFRAKVMTHRWASRLSLWPEPPPKSTIRDSFHRNLPLPQTAFSVSSSSCPT